MTKKLINNLPRLHIVAIPHIPLDILINAPLLRIMRIEKPHVPNAQLPPLPIINLEHHRHVTKIITTVDILPQPRQCCDQNTPRQDPLGRLHVDLHIARRIRQGPAEVGRHVTVVAAREGPVTVLRQVGLGLRGRSSERQAHVAVGEGRGLEAARVKEQIGFGSGDAPEVLEPWLVGAGLGEDLWEGGRHVGGVEEAVEGASRLVGCTVVGIGIGME